MGFKQNLGSWSKSEEAELQWKKHSVGFLFHTIKTPSWPLESSYAATFWAAWTSSSSASHRWVSLFLSLGFILLGIAANHHSQWSPFSGEQIGGSIRRALVRGSILPGLTWPDGRLHGLHRRWLQHSPPDLLHRRLRRRRPENSLGSFQGLR